MSTPPGCQVWNNALGITVAQIHYSADPEKDAQWKRGAEGRFPSPAMWNQEMEINADALMGQLVFPAFDKSINVIAPFPIPHDWTRYMGIDPHPRVPHAFLWLAVSPKADHIYFRDYWPSRAYGLRGDVPEDDDRYTIREYAAAIAWLEGNLDWSPDRDSKSLGELGYDEIRHFGPNGFADNQGEPERIYRRIMDPYGKAVALVRQDGKEETETFWDRYEDLGIPCQPAKKDFNASVDIVCRRLTAKLDGSPQILIFDTCKELILELQTNRYGTLTPTQAATQDPSDRPLPKRKHCLSEGSLVRTLHGEVPIEQIKAGEFVATRSGWKRVIDRWFVGKRLTVSVPLSNGSTLRCTPEHLVWVEGYGFKPCVRLTFCDTLNSWPESFSTAGRTTIAPPEVPAACISADREEKETPISTGIFGSFITGLFHGVATFITRMATALTTLLGIWSVCRPARTSANITPQNGQTKVVESSQKRPALLPQNGIGLSRAANGIRRSKKRCGVFASQLREYVSSVVQSLRLARLPVLAFAPAGARWPAVETVKPITRPESASYAAQSFGSTVSCPPGRARGSVRVVSSPKHSGTARVYDLTVEEAHEFYANGILVHNCTDLLRYLESDDPVAMVRRPAPKVKPLAEGIAY